MSAACYCWTQAADSLKSFPMESLPWLPIFVGGIYLSCVPAGNPEWPVRSSTVCWETFVSPRTIYDSLALQMHFG